MKQTQVRRIVRLNPHHNGIVVGAWMAVTSLLFMAPMLLFGAFVVSTNDLQYPSSTVALFVAFPFLYFVVAYLSTYVGCWLYNVVSRYTGGIEYESRL